MTLWANCTIGAELGRVARSMIECSHQCSSSACKRCHIKPNASVEKYVCWRVGSSCTADLHANTVTFRNQSLRTFVCAPSTATDHLAVPAMSCCASKSWPLLTVLQALPSLCVLLGGRGYPRADDGIPQLIHTRGIARNQPARWHAPLHKPICR